MKGLTIKTIIAISAIFLSTSIFAKGMMMHDSQWICETNASSSSNPADTKADDMMKKPTHGKSAFEYAMKHCRDCTKITCSMQSPPSSSSSNQNMTNQNMNNQNSSSKMGQ